MLENTEYSFLYVIHDNIKVDFILLVTLGVEGMLELNDIRMEKFLHYLQLPVFVPLVLVNLFDGNLLVGFVNYGLEYNAEGAVTDNSLCVIRITGWFFGFFWLIVHGFLIACCAI